MNLKMEIWIHEAGGRNWTALHEYTRVMFELTFLSLSTGISTCEIV